MKDLREECVSHKNIVSSLEYYNEPTTDIPCQPDHSEARCQRYSALSGVAPSSGPATSATGNTGVLSNCRS